MKQITLYDGVFDIGDGAFKNCPDISLINMQRCTDNTKCIKGILSEVNNEIELTINYDDGKAKLIFPYYLFVIFFSDLGLEINDFGRNGRCVLLNTHNRLKAYHFQSLKLISQSHFHAIF